MRNIFFKFIIKTHIFLTEWLEADPETSVTCPKAESSQSCPSYQNDQVLKLTSQSFRSRRHRAQRAAQADQGVLW
jgi:hypothetical protein